MKYESRAGGRERASCLIKFQFIYKAVTDTHIHTHIGKWPREYVALCRSLLFSGFTGIFCALVVGTCCGNNIFKPIATHVSHCKVSFVLHGLSRAHVVH